DPIGPRQGHWLFADATVARASDLGSNDTTYNIRTHLGAILNAGDSVLGYDLENTQFNNDNYEAIQDHKHYGKQIPSAILVKKVYPERKKTKARNWKLKRMAAEDDGMAPLKHKEQSEDRDYEAFLRDIEQDEGLRENMKLYRNKDAVQPDAMADIDSDAEDDDELKIPLEQLVDDMEDLGVEDQEMSG
ncbi:hypothetical protein KC316_g3528, partial [Hortaea werneckii]